MPAATPHRFAGFSPQALAFLRALKKNNDRTWFAQRKERYERECLEPLRALTFALSDALRRARIPIAADPSRAGFRIYRDVRFSPDKSPFKTNLGTYLPHRGVRGAPGGLYVHVAPKESFVAAGFYELDRDRLQRWRSAMAADPTRFEQVLRTLAASGAPIWERGGLKRMPRGFEAFAESPMAPYFKIASFMISRNLSDGEIVAEDLVEQCVALARKAKPLLEYGWSALAGAEAQ